MKFNLKKSVLFTALLMLGTFTFGQQLTFDDLINIRQKKMDEVEKTLHSKKWKSDNTSNSNEVVFKAEKNNSSKWLSVSGEGENNSLTYQTQNKKDVSKIENELIAAGYVLVRKSVNDTQEAFVYQKDNIVVTINTYFIEANVDNVYTVTVGS